MHAFRVLGATLLIASATGAQAREGDQTFYAKGGVFFANVDSTLRLDGTNGRIGTEIDLEDDLGLQGSSTLPFGLVGWRFANNWGVEFEYFNLSRESTKTLERTLVIGDTTYAANATVSAGLSTEVFRLAVSHSFKSGDNYDFGGNLGLHMSNFAVFAEGNGSVNNRPGTFTTERKQQLVPLPTLGLYANYDINKTLTLVTRANYFQLKIDAYKGQLLDASVGVTAKINKNFGVGADFRFVDYKLRAADTDFTGRVDYRFYGPFIYATAGF